MERLRWEHCRNGEVPHNAVRADGHVTVIRAEHNGHWTPGKAVHGHNVAYIPFGGGEVAKHEYEVLMIHGHHEHEKAYKWKSAHQGDVTKRAVVAGTDIDGECLYVAKGVVNGEVCCGKVKPSHKCAYLPWGGKEHRVENYEVLRSKK